MPSAETQYWAVSSSLGGYLPPFAGLSQSRKSKNILDGHKEERARRAIARILRSKSPQVVEAELLKPKTPMFYYVREAKQGECELSFASKAHDHLIFITTK